MNSFELNEHYRFLKEIKKEHEQMIREIRIFDDINNLPIRFTDRRYSPNITIREDK